ncbi:MAG: methyltransferase domain-containing protein [Acidimicrobiia bacterium]|nr:methyltransferase domain-containing protein [Acidimicrobiia bacterium]
MRAPAYPCAHGCGAPAPEPTIDLVTQTGRPGQPSPGPSAPASEPARPSPAPAEGHTRTGTYALDQEWPEERRRLAGMQELWDPGTKTVIESLGIRPGWRCLEVGAGGGSIAAWLAERVGPGGEVLATDVSTRHLDALQLANLEVREHDILGDPLPDAHFDLVHARLVAEHLGRRSLERMVGPLRPGGWLVLEDCDWGAACSYPDDRGQRAVDAANRLLSRSGLDPHYGRALVHELTRAGLEDVSADGRVRVYRGGSLASGWMRLTLESLAAALVESGELTRQELELAWADLDDPGSVFLSASMIAARGRRPH